MTSVIDEAISKEGNTQKGKFLTFLIGKEVYAIEIMLVREIISIHPITQLPKVPPYIIGIINVRGNIIPLIDVRLRFKLEPVPYNQKTSIIIIEVKQIQVGLIVDYVSEVLSIADGKCVAPPDMINRTENRFIKATGITGDHIKLILDCEKLLNDNDFAEINQII